MTWYHISDSGNSVFLIGEISQLSDSSGEGSSGDEGGGVGGGGANEDSSSDDDDDHEEDDANVSSDF